jgi:hypothetical protein
MTHRCTDKTQEWYWRWLELRANDAPGECTPVALGEG